MPQIISRTLAEQLAECEDEQSARQAIEIALRTAGEAGFAAEVPEILSETIAHIEHTRADRESGRWRNLVGARSTLERFVKSRARTIVDGRPTSDP